MSKLVFFCARTFADDIVKSCGRGMTKPMVAKLWAELEDADLIKYLWE